MASKIKDREAYNAYHRHYGKTRRKNSSSYKQWIEENRERLKAYQREYREKNKEKRKEYIEANREKIRAKASDLHKKKKNHANKLSRKWYAENKDKKKQYIKKHQKKFRAIHNEYRRNRMKSDINYKLRSVMRNRINIAVVRGKGVKSTNSLNLLGCTIPQVRQYIESKFKDGMSWDNYGHRGWHIDHIRPCASFDLTDPEQQKQCFHYSNLQPLWAKENMSKGCRAA